MFFQSRVSRRDTFGGRMALKYSPFDSGVKAPSLRVTIFGKEIAPHIQCRNNSTVSFTNFGLLQINPSTLSPSIRSISLPV